MLNRGWAPLTGVLVDRDKFIDLPIAERYDLAADPGGARRTSPGRAPERDRALAATLRAFDAAPPGRAPRGGSRRRRAAARARLRRRAARRRRRATPTPTIRSSSSISIARCTTPSRRSARGGSTTRCGSTRASSRAVPTWRSPTGTSRSSSGSAATRAGAIDALQRAIKAGVTQPAIVAQLGGYLADTGRVAEAIRLLEPLARDAGRRRRNAERARHRLHPRRPPRRRAARRSSACWPIDPDSSVPLENLGRDGARARRSRRRAPLLRARGPRRSAIVARARRARRGRAAAGRSRGARSRRGRAPCSSIPRNFDALYNARHDAGARRTDGRRAPVSRAVPQDRAAGVLCEGSERGRGAAAALTRLTNHEARSARNARRNR